MSFQLVEVLGVGEKLVLYMTWWSMSLRKTELILCWPLPEIVTRERLGFCAFSSEVSDRVPTGWNLQRFKKLVPHVPGLNWVWIPVASVTVLPSNRCLELHCWSHMMIIRTVHLESHSTPVIDPQISLPWRFKMNGPGYHLVTTQGLGGSSLT